VTVLHVASAEGLQNVIRSAIEFGADIAFTDDDGRTPLWFAAREGQVASVRLLLELGAPTGAKAGYGNTELDIARRYRHQDVVDVLRR
jgi:ankyrin repeat protein